MQAIKEENPLSKLTPKQQRELSKREAEKFDKGNDRRSGGEPTLTSEEQNLIIKERDKKRELADENAENSHLQKFTGFVNDPLGYLHSIVSQGEFGNRDQRSQLYEIITLVKIEQDLRELISALKSRK